MERIEKIERLRHNADISFEDARKALEETDWDILDAADYLEKKGIKVEPIKVTKSTEDYDIPPLPSVKTVVETNKQDDAKEEQLSERAKKLFKKFLDYIRTNYVKVEKSGNEIINVPLFVIVILCILSWKLVLVCFIVSLFFNVRYSFYGKNNLDQANDIMDKVSNAAEKVKGEFKKQ